MSNFGERLKALREEKGYKQENIAKILGVSRGAISKYENNEREPDIKIITALTNHFEVSVDYLFGKTDIRSTPDFIPLNIKLIMGDLSVEEFIAELRKKIGITLKKEDMESFIKGRTIPSMGILQAIADYANVTLDFFFTRNTSQSLEKEKNSIKEYYAALPDREKVDHIIKNRTFIRLALKILENGLDLEDVERLLDTAISMKRNHKDPK
ncbi:MAG: helix-turn-helix domain-containing protein [Clostridia bacterium]|nr:helix-turn-helix domain-containing protein [Clostridia bacterium]